MIIEPAGGYFHEGVGEGAIFIYTIDQRETVIYDRGYVTASRSRPPRRCVARLRVRSSLLGVLGAATERLDAFWGLEIGNLGWFFFSIILYFASLVIIGEIEGNDNYLFRRLKIVNKNNRAKISLSFV